LCAEKRKKLKGDAEPQLEAQKKREVFIVSREKLK
jgi:hypothetical protein